MRLRLRSGSRQIDGSVLSQSGKARSEYAIRDARIHGQIVTVAAGHSVFAAAGNAVGDSAPESTTRRRTTSRLPNLAKARDGTICALDLTRNG